MTPYEQAQQQFMSGTYQKHVITGEFIRKEGEHYYTTTGMFHEDWYRLPNELGASM